MSLLGMSYASFMITYTVDVFLCLGLVFIFSALYISVSLSVPCLPEWRINVFIVADVANIQFKKLCISYVHGLFCFRQNFTVCRNSRYSRLPTSLQ